MRGGDIVFISLHSLSTHVHTETWTLAELNRYITICYISPPAHLTPHTPGHLHTHLLPHTSTLTHTSHHPIPTLPPHTPKLFTPLHTLPPSHPPISPLTLHTSQYTHYNYPYYVITRSTYTHHASRQIYTGKTA